MSETRTVARRRRPLAPSRLRGSYFFFAMARATSRAKRSEVIRNERERPTDYVWSDLPRCLRTAAPEGGSRA